MKPWASRLSILAGAASLRAARWRLCKRPDSAQTVTQTKDVSALANSCVTAVVSGAPAPWARRWQLTLRVLAGPAAASALRYPEVDSVAVPPRLQRPAEGFRSGIEPAPNRLGGLTLYPDCRPATIEAFAAMESIATEGYAPPNFNLYTP